MKRKLYAIASSNAPHDGSKIGQWDTWTTPDGHVLLVCEPLNYESAKTHLEGLGATVLPDKHDPTMQVGAISAQFSNAGVLPTDGAYSALKKLHAHYAWPPLHPAE